MTVPYDYDQTNIDHLRAVIAEQEQTIKYLHEHCKAEEVENVKLQDENVKLREERREYQATIDSLVDECADHEADNAKLRELAARALGLFLKHGAVHPCDLSEVDAIMDESRELGIEVES